MASFSSSLLHIVNVVLKSEKGALREHLLKMLQTVIHELGPFGFAFVYAVGRDDKDRAGLFVWMYYVKGPQEPRPLRGCLFVSKTDLSLEAEEDSAEEDRLVFGLPYHKTDQVVLDKTKRFVIADEDGWRQLLDFHQKHQIPS